MKVSAGILLFRDTAAGNREFFLVHPGGPFFRNKQEGWWTIPKGEQAPGEDLLDAAVREFKEETGYLLKGPYYPLQQIQQKGGKTVHCWAVAADIDPATIISNQFRLEWPPRSGLMQHFPEIDQAGWFPLRKARTLINERQRSFLHECNKIQLQQ
jgi:predicted NUDIX family NTP pyrophosphohydrolase